MEKQSILRRPILYETEVELVEYLYGDEGQLISIMEKIISEATAKQLLRVGNWEKVEKFALGRNWTQMEMTEKIIPKVLKVEEGELSENSWYRRLHPNKD